ANPISAEASRVLTQLASSLVQTAGQLRQNPAGFGGLAGLFMAGGGQFINGKNITVNFFRRVALLFGSSRNLGIQIVNAADVAVNAFQCAAGFTDFTDTDFGAVTGF